MTLEHESCDTLDFAVVCLFRSCDYACSAKRVSAQSFDRFGAGAGDATHRGAEGYLQDIPHAICPHSEAAIL